MEIFIFLFIYFLPNVIAFYREHRFKWLILLINLFAGWTLIGWVVCLLWSVGEARLIEDGFEFKFERREK